MTNITQCPNCSSIFAISDEQFSASKGNVRCGACREKFNVVFLPDHDELVVNRTVLQDPGNTNSEAPPHAQSDLLRILSEHAKREELEFAESPEPQGQIESFADNDLEAAASSDLEPSEDASDLFANSFSEAVSEQSDTEYSSTDDQHQFDESAHTFILDESNLLSDELLDEVDSLVTDKLIGDELSETEISDEIHASDVDDDDAGDDVDQPLILRPSWRSRVTSAVFSSFLLLVCLALLIGLSYQLWLKQALPESLVKPLSIVMPFVNPIVENVTNQYDITLPVRQDLNNLQLISAHTEAHPSRASTILLRISLLNKSKITQPLPKLELSLTDEDGLIVSRRSFSPNDYLYNNATENLISSNELKKVTVELLAFPKQAHGYELKMVN